MIESPGTHVRKPVRRRLKTSTSNAGTAVKTDGVAQALDPLLDSQIQAEASVAGSLSAQQTHLQNAGASLNGPESFAAAPNGLDGMADSLSNLFDSFQKLAADPANFGRRRAVVRSAQKVAALFNQAATRLNGLENSLNSSIKEDVDRANQELADIASLNWLILEARAAGGAFNAMTARRTQCLESLSSCVKIEATTQPDGSVNVSIAGVTMVCGSATPDNLATHPDKDGNLRIQAQNAGTVLKLDGGCIAGKIAARDGGLAGLQKGINTLAAQLITRVNTIYNSGRDLNGGTGQDFFTGACASDIGVNSAVAGDLSQLQTAGLATAHGDNAVAQELANLGGRNLQDLDNKTFLQSYTQTISKLGQTIALVNDDLTSSLVVTQMLANERGLPRDASVEKEKADLQRYRQAYSVSAKMMSELEGMTPVE